MGFLLSGVEGGRKKRGVYRQQKIFGGEFKIGCVLLCFEMLIHMHCPAYQGRLALVSLPQGAEVNSLTAKSCYGGETP